MGNLKIGVRADLQTTELQRAILHKKPWKSVNGLRLGSVRKTGDVSNPIPFELYGVVPHGVLFSLYGVSRTQPLTRLTDCSEFDTNRIS